MLCLPKSVRVFEALAFSTDHMDNFDSHYHIGSALDRLASYGDSSIEVLSLWTFSLPPSYPSKFLSLPNLRMLIIPDISEELMDDPNLHWLHQFSLLPRLEALHLILPQNTHFPTVSQEGFPSLTDLEIQDPVDPLILTRFLNALPSDRLLDITIDSDCAPIGIGTTLPQIQAHFEDWTQCLSAVARHHCLKSITIAEPFDLEEIYGDLGRPCYRNTRLLDVTKPLLALKSLRWVDFSTMVALSLSDDDILEFASAWPYLKDLDIGNAIDAEQPSFAAVQHLAGGCPRLKSLGLSIDTTKEPPGIKPHHLHGLRTFKMYDTSLKDPKWIAEQLNSWFRGIDSLSSSSPIQDEEVEKIIELLN